jgi:TonB family protein
MVNKYDWNWYLGRIKKKSFSASLLVHFCLFLLLFLPITKKEEKFEKEIFVVNLVSIPFEMKENNVEKKEVKENIKKVSLEKKVPSVYSLKETQAEKIKENIIEKKEEFSESFSPDEYKKKIYSKIMKGKEDNVSSFTSSSLTENIKIPEIKSTKITPISFDIEISNSTIFSQIPNWYISIIKKKIEENWSFKEYVGKLSSIVSFRIYREGKIENIIIEKSSGYKKFDKSIVDAILSVKNWPPFPEEIKDRYLDIIIEFETEG